MLPDKPFAGVVKAQAQDGSGVPAQGYGARGLVVPQLDGLVSAGRGK